MTRPRKRRNPMSHKRKRVLNVPIITPGSEEEFYEGIRSGRIRMAEVVEIPPAQGRTKTKAAAGLEALSLSA